MEKIILKPYIKTIMADTETPITLYSKYVRNEEGFLLESKEQPNGRYSIISSNPFIIIKSFNKNVQIKQNNEIKTVKGRGLDIVREIINKYEVINDIDIPFVGGAVGTVGYDTIKQYEKIPNENIDTIKVPDIHLMFVRETLVYDHFYNTVNIIVLEEDNADSKKRAMERINEISIMLKKDIILENPKQDEPLKFQCNISKETYINAVEKAKKYIYDGDIFQVVLSQRWSAYCKQSPFTLYRKLRGVNPSPYMFYFKFDDYYVVGSSPEMLVKLDNNKISNCPIAGTRKRGKNKDEDEYLKNDLLNDKKEIAEHVMLVDLGRNDMGKVSKFGSVTVPKYMEVKNYSHVMHITSLVEGEKAEDKDMFDVLMSFLPAGTLSGAPKIRAMEIIEELEISKRGIYGGAIGYFGFNKNMDMCIAIRTMVIKDGIVHVQAGGGIVADSDPEKEYEESQNKAKALIEAINK